MKTMDLLKACREKLRRYRAQHSGEYIGGMEYAALMAELDAAIDSRSAGSELRHTLRVAADNAHSEGVHIDASVLKQLADEMDRL